MGLRFTTCSALLGLMLLVVLSSQASTPAVAQRQGHMSAQSPLETPVPLTSTFGLLTTKPYGKPGVINELFLHIWGPWSWRRGGDPYSPVYTGNANGTPTPNPWHNDLPYGYLYRIDVPAAFPDNELVVQIFDPDTYNNPTHMPTPTATHTQGTATRLPTYTPHANDPRYFWCDGGFECTANQQRSIEPALKLNGFTRADWVQPPWTTGRPAVWRVDEYRQRYDAPSISPPGGNSYDPSWPTESNFTLWHFDPHITNPFGVPEQMSDQPGGAALVPTYTVRLNEGNTDLAWYEPWEPVLLTDPSCHGSYGNNDDCFEREANGNFYFYLYVKSSNGSSENDYDIRVGPKDYNYVLGYDCRTLSGPPSHSICYSNEQFFQQMVSPTPPADWADGGATVSTMRALPLNLSTGYAFPMLFSQVSEEIAGQSLSIRHFDQDCTDCTTPGSKYQLQYCVEAGTTLPCVTGNCEPCSDLLNPGCFGDVADAYRGPNDEWYCSACPNPELVPIPERRTMEYQQFFGPNGECSTSWLRLKQNLSYSNDTTAWEAILPEMGQVTATPTPSNTPSHTFTTVPTNTATPSHTPTNTATNTPTHTATNSPTNTPTGTRTPVPTNTATNTPTHSPTRTRTNTRTNTPTRTNTATNTPTGIPTQPPTNAPTESPTGTVVGTDTPAPTASPTECALGFSDVPPGSTFHLYVICLACQGVISGYACGAPGEPCNNSNDPYFRPNNPVTRGQLAKIVSQSAGLNDPVPGTQQTFQDVPPASTFWLYVERLANHNVMSGYTCGTPGEPCVAPDNRPYFRSASNATRGQFSKIVSNATGFTDPLPPGQYTFADMPEGSAFHLYVERLLLNRPGAMSGYPCGNPGEPCDTLNRPYFRPANNVTRGQTSKIATNVFFPACPSTAFKHP